MIDLSRGVFFRRALLLVILGCFAAAAFCEAQETPAPAIRVDVSRVNVGVTVTDGHGKFLSGLAQSDFHVFDNGVEQPIAGFLANDDPAQVVLMLECGPSLRLFGIENIRRADALIARLAPQDKVAIVCYSSGPSFQFPLSDDLAASRMALRSLSFNAGFANLDLSKSLLQVLVWLHSVPGKKTIVLISSGIDSAPPTIPDDYKSAIIASEVRVLAVSTSLSLKKSPKKRKHDPDSRANSAELKSAFVDADATLKNLADSTGGRVYFPKNAKGYDKAYAEIAQIVRHEYNLAFTPQTFDGKLHTLTVTAKRAARVDHRQAYLAPPPPN
ncbi:MAG: VWA domain-containing protein [Acidobacteria bacterium]|nr:VWA domain-containing protein [Acidobacteriota bacterium]MBS1865656.1 VWA domain-containing protein [Acidobacteriota bacterium]